MTVYLRCLRSPSWFSGLGTYPGARRRAESGYLTTLVWQSLSLLKAKLLINQKPRNRREHSFSTCPLGCTSQPFYICPACIGGMTFLLDNLRGQAGLTIRHSSPSTFLKEVNSASRWIPRCFSHLNATRCLPQGQPSGFEGVVLGSTLHALTDSAIRRFCR